MSFQAQLRLPLIAAPVFLVSGDGIVVLAGGISDGRALRAAEVLGADLAYTGTRFIATRESLAPTARWSCARTPTASC
jgi:NAD(P)H-dependent flavin oxidoreductase YrpB (nitropropane dioxygenase family)